MAQYCNRCQLRFHNLAQLREHRRLSELHWVCEDCNIDFTSRRGLREHFVQSPAHSYCQYCNERFGDDEDLEQHYRTDHDFCPKCRIVFRNADGLHEHRRQSAAHHYCAPCRRLFASASNLNSHLNSSTHLPRTFRCPGEGCTQSFINGSSLTGHLEAGTCVSGMTRKAVNRIVARNDTNNLITDPARLITAAANNTPGTRYFANAASWNGSRYECYLCHDEFRTLPGLNQHLASPRHEEKIYICRGATCLRRFPTLSSLWAHLESEQCGVTRFSAVRRAMDQLVGGMQRARITSS
ncbi:hypothetical protein C8F01DRAFT_1166659 [Mycena amicta]|nr:hypothetical protein C8F01DRAFT_1172965 [Mycena amicta]KAJ7053527.1 hypothetical protein C8F01DRAFT_1166659 [Mycena amicta]